MFQCVKVDMKFSTWLRQYFIKIRCMFAFLKLKIHLGACLAGLLHIHAILDHALLACCTSTLSWIKAPFLLWKWHVGHMRMHLCCNLYKYASFIDIIDCSLKFQFYNSSNEIKKILRGLFYDKVIIFRFNTFCLLNFGPIRITSRSHKWIWGFRVTNNIQVIFKTFSEVACWVNEWRRLH